MAQTMSSKEAAQKWNCTQAEVTRWCREGKIPGATKGGSKQAWQIPVDAVKPGTAEPQQPSVTKRPAHRSSLSIAAGVLLLLAAVLEPVLLWKNSDQLTFFLEYVSHWDTMQWLVLSAASALATLPIAILLFMGRSDKALTAALGVKLLLACIQGIPGIARNLPLICLFLLLLPVMRRLVLPKLWALPFVMGAAVIFITAFNPFNFWFFSNVYCGLEIWGYLFLAAWLANPARTFSSLFFRNMDDLDKTGSILGALFFRGCVTYGAIGAVFILILLIASGEGLFSPLTAPCLFVAAPFIGGIGKIFIGINEGRKATKEVRRSINEVNARSNIPGVSDRARAELNKEAGKQAQKEVIKSAVVGGVIAGDAGAVVGAMSAKAKQDAAKGGAPVSDGKAASKEVVKGAVVGGVIAGDAGAIVGAAAAKAGQEAKRQTDQTK